MNMILMEDETFFSLVDQAVLRILKKIDPKQDKWISGPEAMKKLRIKSKSTLQKLRNEGKIRISQPEKKIILYDQESIDKYLEEYAQDTF